MVSSCPANTNIGESSTLMGSFWNVTNFLGEIGNSSGNWSNSANNETVLRTLPFGADIFLIIDTSIASTWIVLANLIVIISFSRDPKLRILQNYYIVSLATSDLLMGAFVLPLGLYSFLYDQELAARSMALCKFWNCLDFVNSLQSSLSVCLISYDRYKMVLHPVNYRNEESPRRAVTRISCTWTFSILFYGPVTLFWDVWQGCTTLPPGKCDVEFRGVAWLTALQAAVEFGGPLVIMCYWNLRLLVYVKKRCVRMMEMRQTIGLPPTDTTSEDRTNMPVVSLGVVEEASCSLYVINGSNIQHRKTVLEIKEMKKEQRAARSLAILVGTYFILWFWYEVIGNFVDPICGCVPVELYQASYWIQYHISAVNPLIYAVTIDRFRYHFCVFFAFIMPWCVRRPRGKSAVGDNRVVPVVAGAVNCPSHNLHDL